MAEELGRLDALSRETSRSALESDPLIGRLRRIYDDAAEKPLPDSLIHLLDQFDEAERRR